MIRSHQNVARISVGVIAVALALMVPFGAGPVFAQEPEEKGSFAYAPLSGAEMPREEADDSGGGADEEAWWPCNYETRGDYVHLSSTGFAASAHGWWLDNSDGDCPEHADVEVTLQALVCYYNPDPGPPCYWDTLGTPANQRIKARNLSGQRTTARHNCASSQTVAYRSIVDVDLVGQWDGPFKLYTATVEIPCYPAQAP